MFLSFFIMIIIFYSLKINIKGNIFYVHFLNFIIAMNYNILYFDFQLNSNYLCLSVVKKNFKGKKNIMKKAQNYAWDILPNILNSESMASNCGKAVKLVQEYIKKLGYKSTLTNKGGIIFTIPGKNKKKSRLISAHLDTLGAMVKSIGGNGRIYITPIGGVNPFSVEGEYITIETADGKKRFRGTILHNDPSMHVNRDLATDKRSFKNISIRLDEKVRNAEDVEKLGIEIGDYCFFDPRVEITKSGFCKSRHLDDKAGVAAILASLEYITRKKVTLEYDTMIYISVAEEIGMGVQSKIPENCFELIAIDMGALGEGQSSDEYSVSICAKDSSGPFDLGLRNKIVNLAKKHKIEYKLDIYPFYGSDAAAALKTGVDAKHMLFGPGIDASHSFERVHKDSMDATVELIIRYLMSK